MTKTKIISVILIVTMLCCICLVVAGCPAKEENTKYNVAMKIVCKEVVDGKVTGPILGEWIFTQDVSEIHIQREYDGKQYDYFLDSYCLYDHPEHPDIWLSPRGSDRFEQYLAIKGQLVGEPNPKYVCEAGNYCLNVEASNRGTLWNQRFIWLYIDVV